MSHLLIHGGSPSSRQRNSLYDLKCSSAHQEQGQPLLQRRTLGRRTHSQSSYQVNATIDYLISVDLTIGGHNYLLAEIDYESPWGGGEDIIGGVAEGIDYIQPGTNDFWLRWNRETLEVTDFSYSAYASSVELSDFWYATSYEASISAETAPVPEPSTMVLMGLGLAGLAGFGRKKFKK